MPIRVLIKRHLRLGRRGTLLALFGVLLGLGYGATVFRGGFGGDLPPGIPGATRAWGTLWMITGLIAVCNAFLKQDGWGFAALQGMVAAWAIMQILAGLAGMRGAAVEGFVWLVLSVILSVITGWPEPPPERVGRHGR